MNIRPVRSCIAFAAFVILGSGALHAGPLTPPGGPVASTGVTTQQIYDSVQGLVTTNGESGVRAPGTAFTNPATMVLTPSSGVPFTTPIFNATAQFTRPVDMATGQAAGQVQFNGMTVIRDAGNDSGQFFGALMTNRNFATVVLTLSTTPPVTYTLVNARVVSYRLLMTQRPGGSFSEVEEIGFQFLTSMTISDGTNSGVFIRP